MKSKTTFVLWLVYIAILAVLLPHTAWAFSSVEPSGVWFVPWAAAFGFEAAIAALTYKLAEHIEQKPKGKRGIRLFFHRYVNAFSFGLLIATGISALANLAHAVEFGKALKIFAEWGIPSAVYSLAFGGILPLVSLTFARVLSNVVDDEDAPNPELEAARAALGDVRKQLRESEQQRKVTEDRAKSTEQQLKDTEQRLETAEQAANWSEERANGIEDKLRSTERQLQSAEDRARLAEERFGAMGDVVRYLFGEDKRQRIIYARRTWAKLPNSALAIIAESSPSYVSEVLNAEPIDVTDELTVQAGKP